MSKRVELHVDGLAEMGERFIDAWHRAEAGEDVDETHVTFLSLQLLMETLTPRRLELLRHVRQHGAMSVRELATSLGRDYKNVHQDAVTLEAAGLLVREGRRLIAPWDEVQASVKLVAA